MHTRIHIGSEADRQTYRQESIHTYEQIIHTTIHTYRDTYIHTDWHTCSNTYSHT